jgi:glutathione synthase/RimK-type ligase-like ATP-grasp enzyme
MGLLLNPHVTWVNAIDNVSVAEHKLYQLQVARRCGLRVPRTIVSGDAGALRAFVAGNPAGTICKPIFHGLFFDAESRYAVYTRRIDADSLDADCGKPCPILLQEEIARSADVRATFIGSSCYVADIRSKDPIIDWRDPDAAIEYSRSMLTDPVQSACRRVMDELGLLYGAFDFIRTPDDELVFLEINPTGEWAWLEETLGFPMREAFIELFYGDRP